MIHWNVAGNPMTSATKEAEFKMLLNLEVRLQLLDTEGLILPSNPCPVPSDPPNYNFHYKWYSITEFQAASFGQ